jgi:ATPase
MNEKEHFEWIRFYKEFALKLLEYRDKRNQLVEKVRAIYTLTGMNMPTLERENNLVDIDPFTVFGLFNKKLTDDKRIAILKAISKLFSIETDVPKSFDSLPVLNPQNATFYYFIGQRDDKDIDDLWGLFASALDYAQNPTVEHRAMVSHYFDLVINKKGNGNSKITMGLYWISPDSFLNLDSRNEWYIYVSGKVPINIVNTLPAIEPKISADKYFLIVELLRNYLQSSACELNDFKELSFAAWKYSEQVNREKLEKKKDASKIKDTLTDDVDTVHYWIFTLTENLSIWNEFYNSGIMAMGWGSIGSLKDFKSQDTMKVKMKTLFDDKLSYKNTSHTLWQFVNEMKVNDIVFVKIGKHRLVGRGIVTSDYEFDSERPNEYKNIRQMNWTHKGEWPYPGQATKYMLTDISSYGDYVKELVALFDSESGESIEEVEKSYPTYTREDFLSEVYIPEAEYDKLVGVLSLKKNIILQGAPGVGKTFIAKRLAFSMMGVKDVERVMMVQFHQSYSYEDFIMGFRPSSGGFELKRGAFYNFCKKAEIDGENDYFFIIDEINRGNLSKIFGELFMLIENDKRGLSLQLLYSDEMFSVPKNIYIIGMMNTADRSLAMLDYALRRRFAFFEIKPGFTTDGFREYRMNLGNERLDKLITCVEDLNNVIANDESLGEGFCIGHSYFCNLMTETIDDQVLSGIIEYELIPLLKEYWFDESEKVRDWSIRLRGAIK